MWFVWTDSSSVPALRGVELRNTVITMVQPREKKLF